MELARLNGCKTIAFPAISCGAYGYPLEQAAAIAVSTLTDKLKNAPEFEKVYLVCFGEAVLDAYTRVLNSGETQ